MQGRLGDVAFLSGDIDWLPCLNAYRLSGDHDPSGALHREQSPSAVVAEVKFAIAQKMNSGPITDHIQRAEEGRRSRSEGNNSAGHCLHKCYIRPRFLCGQGWCGGEPRAPSHQESECGVANGSSTHGQPPTIEEPKTGQLNCRAISNCDQRLPRKVLGRCDAHHTKAGARHATGRIRGAVNRQAGAIHT